MPARRRYNETSRTARRPDGTGRPRPRVWSMPRLAWTISLLALTVPALAARGADQPRPADVQALQERIEQTIERAEPSIACILVSRSDAYGEFQAAPPDEGAGNLGEFNAGPWTRSDPLDDFDAKARERRRLAKSLDLSG